MSLAYNNAGGLYKKGFMVKEAENMEKRGMAMRHIPQFGGMECAKWRHIEEMGAMYGIIYDIQEIIIKTGNDWRMP